MGTRSITIFKDANRDEPEIGVLYRQHDGYPSEAGADILECFKDHVAVNGINADNQINGAGDMAVQLIAFLKTKSAKSYNYKTKEYETKPVNTPGGFYLEPAGTRDCGEEYVYTLTFPKYSQTDFSWKGQILLTVEDTYHDKVLYEGPLNEFDPQAAEKLKDED